MSENVFEELKRYVGFDADDEQALRRFHPIAEPHFVEIARVFYDRILTHDGARIALQGGESTVGRLKVTLVEWMGQLLTGPWDDAYFERRCRIGRMHVRISLPQHYMFGAMNVVRRELTSRAEIAFDGDPDTLARTRRALGKILDLELAIMLHTYREDLVAQAERHERLATFGQLVGSIGHELRNPLGVMETSLYILSGRVGEDERAKKHVERIGQQLGVANHIVSDLLDLIRDTPLARERVVVADVVKAAVEAVRRPDGVRVELVDLELLPPLSGDANQLRQVFVNLLENAVFAASPEGVVRVSGSTRDGGATVVVQDSGPGVDPAVRRRLFEPLITNKVKGVGLGLALVKRIVERHGGSIAYEPDPATPGARFVLRFP